MTDEENPDIYICALLTQMVTAREGDIRREFQAVIEVLNRLRGWTETFPMPKRKCSPRFVWASVYLSMQAR